MAQILEEITRFIDRHQWVIGQGLAAYVVGLVSAVGVIFLETKIGDSWKVAFFNWRFYTTVDRWFGALPYRQALQLIGVLNMCLHFLGIKDNNAYRMAVLEAFTGPIYCAIMTSAVVIVNFRVIWTPEILGGGVHLAKLTVYAIYSLWYKGDPVPTWVRLWLLCMAAWIGLLVCICHSASISPSLYRSVHQFRLQLFRFLRPEQQQALLQDYPEVAEMFREIDTNHEKTE